MFLKPISLFIVLDRRPETKNFYCNISKSEPFNIELFLLEKLEIVLNSQSFVSCW